VKILFFTENFPPETNAAATRVYERALYWVRWGHTVTVITCAPNFPHGRVFDGYRNRWRQVEDMDGIRVVRVKTYIAANRGVIRRSLDFLSFLVTGFLAGVAEERPDVVAATSPQFFAAVAGWAVGGVRRLPFVFELGDLWPTSISAVGAMKKGILLGLVERFELFLYRRSAAVAALTHAFKRNLIGRGIKADKIHVVVNGVDLDRYGPRGRNTELAREWGLGGKFVIGYVGTHGMAHGLINVIDAAERLVGEDHIQFLLAGSGAERQMLIDEAGKRSLGNVVFLPPQPKENMPRVWSLCDVALVHLKDSPAFAEVIPSKIFEAMAMGLPLLLAAPEGEASAILSNTGAGLWVPAERPDDLADAVRRLAGDEEKRKYLASAALAAAPSYSREKQAREMMEVFSGVLGRAGMQESGRP
jgi:colanic acid biosynthesis glycosyl transferase WcaI